MMGIDIAGKCRLRALDWLLALCAGLVASALYYFIGIGAPDASQWDALTEAAGLLPPRSVVPGLWRALAALLFGHCGVEGAMRWLVTIGVASGGVCVFLAFLIIRMLISHLIRMDAEVRAWNTFLAPGISFAGAMLFAFADPVWRVTQTFSADSFRLVLFVFCVFLWLRWITHGSAWRLYPLVMLVGILVAETPLAFILPVLFLVGYFRFWMHVEIGHYEAARRLPPPDLLPKWRMFYLFLATVGVAVWYNGRTFTELGGIAANAWSPIDLYFRYAIQYASLVLTACPLLGWVLGLAFCVSAMIVTLAMTPFAISEERPLMFRHGVLIFAAGSLAALQTGAVPPVAFWTSVMRSSSPASGLVLALFSLCAAIAVAIAAAAFAFETQRFYAKTEEEKPQWYLRWVVPAVLLVIAAMSACHLSRSTERGMLEIVYDAVDETLAEAKGSQWLFTDGHLDNAVRLRAAATAQPLVPFNMMADSSPWERYIRTREFPDDETDRENAKTGVPALLRVWACEKPGALEPVAVQLGFELWKREQKPLPPLSGLMGREKGWDEDELERANNATRKIAERIVELGQSVDGACVSRALKDAYTAVSWRLSRMAHLRNDEDFADKIEASNSVISHLLNQIEYERHRTFMQLTPQEGLQIALRRADFADARQYALAVIGSDPDNTDANFALGMGALVEERMEEAERYLRRCLIRKPDEPAVLNNLSIICRKAKRYDEALKFAEKAIRLVPDIPEVQRVYEAAKNRDP